MTRKLTRKTPTFRGIASFIAALTVLIMIALAALAQTTGTAQRPAQHAAVSGQLQLVEILWPSRT
jgi:hypothetical protein